MASSQVADNSTSTAEIEKLTADLTIQAPKQVALTCGGHTRPVVQLQYSPIINDEFYLISACKDGMPILREGKTGDWLGTFLGHKGAVWSAKLNQDASLAVTGSADFTANVWDAYSGSIIHTFQHKHIVKSVDFNKEGSVIVTGGNEKLIRAFDLNKPDAEIFSIPHGNSVKSLVFDSARNFIFSSGEDNLVRIWDSRSLELVKSLSSKSNLSSMNFSIDNKVIMATAGQEIDFWDIEKLELYKNFKLDFQVNTVSLLPDQHTRFVTSGNTDGWLRVHDFESGEQLELYKGHHGPVHYVSYSPDGQIYASGSEDGTVRLWQTNPGTNYGLWQSNKEVETERSPPQLGVPIETPAENQAAAPAE